MLEDQSGPFATLTHASLRARQGDVEGARRILRGILAAEPAHADAAELLTRLDRSVAVRRREPAEPEPPPARAATASELSERFRDALEAPGADSSVDRLKDWLDRAAMNREGRRVR